jgi:hypothetical protein
MERLTLAVAAAACVLVFCLPPAWWLVVYIATLTWYPSYLTVKVGTLDFSAPRIVILAIYASLFFRQHLLNRFRVTLLDIFVLAYFFGQLLAGAMTTDLPQLLENRSGAAFDMLLPYLAVRAIITDKQRCLSFLKASMYVVAPVAVFGLYESVTGHNPAGFLQRYMVWGSVADFPTRHGFYRAWFTTSHPIMLGMFFAILGPLWAGLLYQARTNRPICYAGIALAGVGVFSSMSSGPALAALVATAFIAFYRYRRYWKIAVAAIVLMCATIEIVSNRHFYYYSTRFMLSGSSAWYRGRLLDVALFEGGMSGHWLSGYGLDTAAAWKASFDWSARIDGRYSVDMVNQYLLVVFQFGLIALVPFVAAVCAAIKSLIEAFRSSLSDSNKLLIWCLSGSVVGLLVSFFTVSLHTGQTTSLFYITIALCGVMPMIISDENSHLVIKANPTMMLPASQGCCVKPAANYSILL